MVRKLFSNKIFVFLMAAAAAAFVFLQFIPQDEALANPPVVREPNWDSAETRALAKRACFDCHSNETDWPWYARVQPMSMMMQQDIAAARSLMNFSEWKDVTFITADLIEKKLRAGEMPLPEYVLMHPDAKLTDAEIDALVAGLRKTFAASSNQAADSPENRDNAN